MLYGTRQTDDRELKDFTYMAETGPRAEGLREEYKHPDDGQFTRKGFPKISRDLRPPAPTTDQPYDPESELASFLYMSVSGQIETASINTNDLIQAKYTFIAGTEWDLIEGDRIKESQFAKKLPGTDFITWNLDFQIGYRCLSPEGWPKIVIELKTPTKDPEVFEVSGYTCVHVPTMPGTSSKKAKIFCPVRDSWWSIFKAKLLGPKCEVIENPDQIAECEGREVTSVFYTGEVLITFNVIQRNFERFGYKTF